MGLTTALYYTPNGRSIQAEGIMPDIIVERSVIKEKVITNNIREENLNGYIPKNSLSGTTKSNLSINKNKKTVFNDFNIVNNNKIILNNSYQIGDIVEIIYLY